MYQWIIQIKVLVWLIHYETKILFCYLFIHLLRSLFHLLSSVFYIIILLIIFVITVTYSYFPSLYFSVTVRSKTNCHFAPKNATWGLKVSQLFKNIPKILKNARGKRSLGNSSLPNLQIFRFDVCVSLRKFS